MLGPGGLVSQHALRQTPPSPERETATAADGTHPTGMHSCFSYMYKLKTVAPINIVENITSAKKICRKIFS